jgi:Ion transport protein
VYSLPTLGNVASVVMLFFYIFAVIGMSLLGRVKPGPNLDRHANFRTFPNAVLLLFRMSTGESWDYVMQVS